MKNYSKEDFGYVVSSITGFTDQTSQELMMKALVGGTTAKVSNVKLGIKGTQQIQILDSTPAFQAGACGWSPSGTTTFSQISLTVCPERINENLCPDALYSTYQSLLLQKGETEESVPFEQQIADLKVKQIQQRIEQKLWQATTAGGDCFDGFKALLVSGATGTAVSGEANSFAVHPNSTVKVYPTIGLAGSGRVVIGPADYFVVGFDLMSDHEKLDMWWSRDNDEIRIRGNYNYGAALVRFAGVNYFATNNIA